MKSFDNLWRLLLCAFIFACIYNAVNKTLVSPPPPHLDMSHIPGLKSFENRQFQPIFKLSPQQTDAEIAKFVGPLKTTSK